MRRSPRILFAGFACFGLTFAACSSIEGGADATTTPPTTVDVADDSGATESEPVTEPEQTTEPELVAVPELDGLPGSIVVRDDFGQIVVVQPTGSDPVTLSEAGSDHTQPTWSSAGDRIAWSSFGPSGAALSVADRTGENRRCRRTPAPFV